jgi:hypothetical protein
MNKLAFVAAAALSVAAFGAAAVAQDTSVADFDKVDANKDAVVSWDEALGAYPTLTQELFTQADANADGSLDASEFTALVGLTAGVDANAATSSSSAM